jgi:hypothetical protein
MTLEMKIIRIMSTSAAFESYKTYGDGLTFYDYVRLIVIEYRKIAIDTFA